MGEEPTRLLDALVQLMTRSRRLLTWLAGCSMVVAPTQAIAAEDEETTFLRNHRRTQLWGMGMLTGWAVGNIGTGVAGALLTSGERRHVHEMNAMWNSVNLTLGIIGLARHARRDRAPSESMHRTYRKTVTTYVVNGALDVVYMSAGVFAAELGRRHGSARALGYGKSVVLQGAFLFVFDLGMAIAHERAAARVANLRVAPQLEPRALGLVASGSF